MRAGEKYDDGGYTGANIDRPALQKLIMFSDKVVLPDWACPVRIKFRFNLASILLVFFQEKDKDYYRKKNDMRQGNLRTIFFKRLYQEFWRYYFRKFDFKFLQKR